MCPDCRREANKKPMKYCIICKAPYRARGKSSYCTVHRALSPEEKQQLKKEYGQVDG